MKKFANKLSVRVNKAEARELDSLLLQIGYGSKNINIYNQWCISNLDCRCEFGFYWVDGKEISDLLILDHFNKDLIRDIVSVCSNETWQLDEPMFYKTGNEYKGIKDNSLSHAKYIVDKTNSFRRPTVAEICNHYGYHLEDNNIVKNIEKPTLEERVARLEEVMSSTKPCCEPEHWKWFTTDGCKIKTGDMVFYVDDDLKVRSFKFLGANNHTPSKDWTFFKFTSLYEADCEGYVSMNKPFEPVDVVITCNSPEELRGLWHTLNVSQTKAQEKAKNGTYIGDFSIDTYKWWRTVDSVLDNLNLNLDTKK